jgi:hypothetical protein
MQNLQKFLALEEKEIQTKEEEDKQPQSRLSLSRLGDHQKTKDKKSSWRQWRRYEGTLPKKTNIVVFHSKNNKILQLKKLFLLKIHVWATMILKAINDIKDNHKCLSNE